MWDKSFIIPPSFFETRKLFIFIETPYCDFDVIKSKYFLTKFQKITTNCFRIAITWKTRDIRSLFPLEDKNHYRSCVIYEEDCSCDSRYIGETNRNPEVR